MIVTQNDYDTLVGAQKALREDGYTDSFRYEDNHLINDDNSKTYGAEDLKITTFYRFEGMSSAGDMSILYAIAANDDSKGILVATYGTYANEEMDKFIKGIAMTEREDMKQ